MVLQVLFVSLGSAQDGPRPDSVVAGFLERGYASDWMPYEIFGDCPNFAKWQLEAFQLLMTAPLTATQEANLAGAWAEPLARCQDVDLERWYLGHLEKELAPTRLSSEVRLALSRTKSPRVLDHLFELMIDTERPAKSRVDIGELWMAALTCENRRREFARAFATARLPDIVASSLVNVLVRDDPDGLSRDVGAAVRQRPELAFQTAFEAVVQITARLAPRDATRRLAADLSILVETSELDSAQRAYLERSHRHLFEAGQRP